MSIGPHWNSGYREEPHTVGVFHGLHFHTHTNKYDRTEAVQLCNLLKQHGATSHKGFKPADVIFVFLDPPQKNVVVPLHDVNEMCGVKFTLDEVFQHFAARTNTARDQTDYKRKRVVQAEWVHECLTQGRRIQFSEGWEVRVNNGPSLGNGQVLQRPPPMIRSLSPMSNYAMPLNGAISNQLPDFAMTGPRLHPDRLQQIHTGTSSCGRGASMYGSNARCNDHISVAHTRSFSPPASTVTPKTSSNHQVTSHVVQESKGIFARGFPIPLAFHILAGPLQKVAEMTVTKMGGGIIVPLHRASFIIIPEMNIRVVTNERHERLINDPDPSRALISFDWVTDCVEQDRLIGLDGYKLKSSSNFNSQSVESFRPPSDHSLDSPETSIKSGETIARITPVSSPSHKSEHHTNIQGTNNESDVAGPGTSNSPTAIQQIGQPTPPMSPNIVSVAAILKDIDLQALSPGPTGSAPETLEVPEDLMDAFFLA